MKHEVLRDFGVQIAGKTYPHGSVVDSDKIVPEVDPSSLPASMTDEEKRAEVQKQQEANARQAQADYAAANDAGYFGPHEERPAEARKAVKKGQEG